MLAAVFVCLVAGSPNINGGFFKCILGNQLTVDHRKVCPILERRVKISPPVAHRQHHCGGGGMRSAECSLVVTALKMVSTTRRVGKDVVHVTYANAGWHRQFVTRSSAAADEPHDALCHCQQGRPQDFG